MTKSLPSKENGPVGHDRKTDLIQWNGDLHGDNSVEGLKRDIVRHVVTSLGNDYARPSEYTYYHGLALAIRDRMISQWIKTQRSYYKEQAKRVYYLSMEYLPGKSLMNSLHCLGMQDMAKAALADFGLELENVAEVEWDAGLGNGGLGRLASCYLDSMATQCISGYGYGIRYDYGMFHQVIEDGAQVEHPDNWTKHGTPWEFDRARFMKAVNFFGRVHTWVDDQGRLRHDWVETEKVLAMACDLLVPGFRNGQAINMRLWAAKSDTEFNLDFFNTGDYIGALEAKIRDETISKVLYPSDEKLQGRVLRLCQQYFFVAASLEDILRRYKKKFSSFDRLPEMVVIQLNDTHPTIAVPELMRILVDEELLDWDMAWDLCTRVFAYTNHTVLPEALETWPCSLIQRVLPRHMEIIYEINQRFLQWLDSLDDGHPDPGGRKSRLSVIQEHPEKAVRMANLAIIGSFSVNGVAAMHTEIIKSSLFSEFHAIFPGRFRNVTNGVTPRRWLNQCNPELTALISEKVSGNWLYSLDRLRELVPHAEDPAFRARWREVKQENKKRLTAYVARKLGFDCNLNAMFDVQVKRIHEYKRQLLNVLHVITLYNRIKADPSQDIVPRAVFFGGKAAPAYTMAKLIIRLINGVADVVNTDSDVNGRLQVIFLPNYCVSQAERIIPATELSEQISTAGYEASGTGNMKFALNGALTIGTLDGANVEMLEEIGAENMFIFGRTADEIKALRREGYNPWHFCENDPELKQVLSMISNNVFSPQKHGLFAPVIDNLLHRGDYFCVLADYRAYVACQELVSALYRDQDEWTRRSILNTANMGKFSSDRSVMDYAQEIWGVEPLACLL
ncbi:MAG: glycogen/starch/alpha-glucan phosphorylase [Desulfovibrionales bacterium]|nr:MAG: glycogen/starch/alpha-glucan phosphorylase [Desulfovibrionales bacterium]